MELADGEARSIATCIVDALGTHICLLDRDGTIVAANEAWRRFGRANPPVPDQVFVGENYLAVCDRAGGPDSTEAAPFASRLRALLRGEISECCLEYPCHAPGDERWFIARATCSPGDPFRAVIAHEDITAQRTALESLRESEARLRALFEHSLVPILFTAPEGRVLAANAAACQLLERSEADICRVGRHGLVDPGDDRVEKLVWRWAEDGHALGEINLLKADGTPLPALVSSVVFDTSEGPRTWMTLQDLSEARTAEDRLRAFSRQLIRAREDERRQVAAALHHDVGSIAVGVTARLIAVEEELRAGRGEAALAALSTCRRLFAEAVTRLRALAVDLRPPDLDLVGLQGAVRQHLVGITRDTSLTVQFTDATQGAPILREAQTILFRSVQECLNNVVKHAGANRVRIGLSATDDQVMLVVSDDGRGFDPSESAAQPGPRLGLRTLREMVLALGGELWVEAARGKGTIVGITIPRVGAGS